MTTPTLPNPGLSLQAQLIHIDFVHAVRIERRIKIANQVLAACAGAMLVAVMIVLYFWLSI